MGSPLDTDLANKKRLKIFSKPVGINQAQEAANVNKLKVVDAGQPTEAQGLNLMRQVVTCDEGMSPTIDSF